MFESIDDNDQNWEDGLSPAADALHHDIDSRDTSTADAKGNKLKLNLKFEYTPDLPLAEMDSIIGSLDNSFLNTIWGETKDDITLYYAKAACLQSECLTDEEDGDLRSQAEARTSLDQALRALHGSIMTNLNILARAYYKKKGEAKWYEYFLKGSYHFSPEVFDNISDDLMKEYGQAHTAVNPIYRERVKGWFLSRAEDA
ncbi:MAG TPA: hypothetical protein PK547_02190 [Candidatus Paceibacterota bacterium]|nr:hypothetical protein [Candidatus Paceibacterota bacterium]